METAEAENCFVDANVLVYAAIGTDIRHSPSKNLLQDGYGLRLCVSPQVLSEFYSVITNAKRVTDPFTPTEATEFIRTLLGNQHVSPSRF